MMWKLVFEIVLRWSEVSIMLRLTRNDNGGFSCSKICFQINVLLFPNSSSHAVLHHLYQKTLGKGGKEVRQTIWMSSSKNLKTRRSPERTSHSNTSSVTSSVRSLGVFGFPFTFIAKVEVRNEGVGSDLWTGTRRGYDGPVGYIGTGLRFRGGWVTVPLQGFPALDRVLVPSGAC